MPQSLRSFIQLSLLPSIQLCLRPSIYHMSFKALFYIFFWGLLCALACGCSPQLGEIGFDKREAAAGEEGCISCHGAVEQGNATRACRTLKLPAYRTFWRFWQTTHTHTETEPETWNVVESQKASSGLPHQLNSHKKCSYSHSFMLQK